MDIHLTFYHVINQSYQFSNIILTKTLKKTIID